MIEVLIWVITISLFCLGIIGIIAPIIPSLPLIFCGTLVYAYATHFEKITLTLILLFGAIAIVGTALDFIANAYGAKKFGASRYGVVGALAGSLIGVFFGPVGIIIGAFGGALACEFFFCRNYRDALRAGIGTFIGFLFGTLLKIVLAVVMIGIFFTKLF